MTRERDLARARLAEVEAQNSALVAEVQALAQHNADEANIAAKRLAEVEAQAAAMREALERYGSHDGWSTDCDPACPGHDADCSCGFSAALSLDSGRAYAAEHAALQRLVSNLETWTHEMGAALIPLGADTFGEGVRVTKDAVAAKISNAMSLASLLDEVRRGR